MKQKSIRVNFFLNSFRVGLSTLLGLFTMPYINRVLGVENIGSIEYVYSIVNYFILFSALGIPMYGIRAVARVRDNIPERNKAVFELLVILFVTTIISYIVFFGFLLRLSHFERLKDVMIIMSSMIFFTNFGVEWFFQGMENQLYITIRYVLIRVIAFFLLFLVVKTPDDLVNYTYVFVLSTVGSNILNLFFIFKFIKVKDIKFQDLDFKKHFKPIFTIFIATISISIYLQLDNVMLGTISGEKSVGYYSIANKLIRYVILFITISGSVMLPRLSNLILNDRQGYINYANKCFKYILLGAIPFMILFFFLSHDFIVLLAGDEFLPSIITMKILSPLIIIVGVAYFIGFLVLYPQGKEIVYTLSVMASALFSVICNFFIIPIYSFNGAAFVTVFSETLGILMMLLLGKDLLKELKLFDQDFVKYIVSSIIMILTVYFVSTLNLSIYINIIVSSFVGFLCFFIVLFLLKEQVTKDFCFFLHSYIFRIKK